MVAPKNLVFFLSDNHARSYSGAYGHPDARMPHLDALAERGVRFDNAYSASPLCCPARASIATGRYPHQTGLWDNAIVYDGGPASWMHRVRDAGHPVVSIGKLHFRETKPENGFSQELEPMHILDGKGGVHMLLRGYDAEPRNAGQWNLYMDRSGVGEAPYQAYDRRITETAIDWLNSYGDAGGKPWILFVSYPSPHPPFSVPQDFYSLFDEAQVKLPVTYKEAVQQAHPAIEHFKWNHGAQGVPDEASLRKVVTGYLALLAHLDAEMGKILDTLEGLGLASETRILYTSDHGEMCGAHSLFGKCCMYEEAIGVPLVMAGPDIPACRAVGQIVSHVDLFPTIVESVGATLDVDDGDLPGVSLWPAIQASESDRVGFAEFHAAGSKSGMFMLRDGDWKLVYHVGLPPQLFNLARDPDEANDLGPTHPEITRLESRLRDICDPEAVDAQAKADQRAWIEHWGGREAVLAEGSLIYTPPPGGKAEISH